MSLLNAPPPRKFTHTTLDTMHGIRVYCSGPDEPTEGVDALPLGHATFAPARALSVTGEAFALVLRVYPIRMNETALYVAKGLDQYRLSQPDAEQLCFELHTNSLVRCCACVTNDWYGGWHTVAAVYDGENVELAVDGELLASAPASGCIQYAPGACSIGIDPFTGAQCSGAVAALQIYGEAPASAADLSANPTLRGGCNANVQFAGLERMADAGLEISPLPTAQLCESGPIEDAPGPALDVLPPLEIHEKDNVGYFSGEGFRIEVDLPTATITSWRVDDVELLELGPVHQLWRPPVFSELVPAVGGPSVAAQWVEAGYAENLMGTTAMEALQQSPHCVTLKFQGLIIRRNSDVLFEVSRSYTIYGHGEVLLEQTLSPKAELPPLGRLGLEIRIPKPFGAYTLGLADKRSGDVQKAHWAALRSAEGHGLLVWSHTPFLAALSPYSVFQNAEALYPETLTPDSANTLHLDHAIAMPPASNDGADLHAYGTQVNQVTTALRMRGMAPEDQDPEAWVSKQVPR